MPIVKRNLYTRCCDGIARSEELNDMYDKQRQITFRTFSKHVNMKPIIQELGYAYGAHAEGLRIAKDYAVRFYKSVFKGEPCYYMDWSAIDHIFLLPEQVTRLAR